MTWYITKGQELERDKPISFRFCRRLKQRFKQSELIFIDKLAICDYETAPAYPTEGITKMHCIVTSDLSSLSRRKLPKLRGRDGKEYYEIDFNLTLTAKAAGLQFALEREGKVFGSVEAKFE